MEEPLRWRRWLVLVAAGELVGFVVPAVTGILVRDASAAIQLTLMPIAGLVEGATLGCAQAVVLRRSWVALHRRAWIVATSLAAAVAWFLGMLPSTTHETWSTWPTVWIVAVAAALGVGLLVSIGTAQALVLPSGTRGRLAWVGWTALAWCVGLIAFSIVAPPLWQPHQPLWLLTFIGVLGGVAMAVAMAAVTGVGAVRLVDRAHHGKGARAHDPALPPHQHPGLTRRPTSAGRDGAGVGGRVAPGQDRNKVLPSGDGRP